MTFFTIKLWLIFFSIVIIDIFFFSLFSIIRIKKLSYNHKFIYKCIKTSICSFDGVVVITSALHAEGREFDPRSKYVFSFLNKSFMEHLFINYNLFQFTNNPRRNSLKGDKVSQNKNSTGWFCAKILKFNFIWNSLLAMRWQK